MRRMYSKKQLLEAVEQEAEVNGLKAFENIVDKDGHKRFIEGDIATETISGIEFTYGKWSLSGSHLMIVLAGNADNGASIPYTLLGKCNVPKWIYDKIFPIKSTTIDYKGYTLWDSSFNVQNGQTRFIKDSNAILIYNSNTLTLTADRSFRISFDLLIDNE